MVLQGFRVQGLGNLGLESWQFLRLPSTPPEGELRRQFDPDAGSDANETRKVSRIRGSLYTLNPKPMRFLACNVSGSGP